MEPLKFIAKVEQTTLEVTDHGVVGRAKQQSIGNFLFNRLESPLEIEDMVGLWHGFV